MPNLYEYFDYRQFLKDEIEYKKSKNSQYSFRSFARALDLNSSTLLRVIGGQRNISKKNLPNFIKALKFNEKEAEYFELLVLMDQAKDMKTKLLYRDKISFFRKTNIRNLEPEEHEFYESWYNSVIRELIELESCSEKEYKKLAKLTEPEILPKEVKKSLQILQALGLVCKGDDGNLHQTDNYISTGDMWNGISVHRFQKLMAELGMNALDKFEKKERDISTLTLSLSDSGFDKLKEILKETRQKIFELGKNEQQENRVYQVNLQMFPLSKRIHNKDDL